MLAPHASATPMSLSRSSGSPSGADDGAVSSSGPKSLGLEQGLGSWVCAARQALLVVAMDGVEGELSLTQPWMVVLHLQLPWRCAKRHCGQGRIMAGFIGQWIQPGIDDASVQQGQAALDANWFAGNHHPAVRWWVVEVAALLANDFQS